MSARVCHSLFQRLETAMRTPDHAAVPGSTAPIPGASPRFGFEAAELPFDRDCVVRNRFHDAQPVAGSMPEAARRLRSKQLVNSRSA
jgi:hypothetical protein